MQLYDSTEVNSDHIVVIQLGTGMLLMGSATGVDPEPVQQTLVKLRWGLTAAFIRAQSTTSNFTFLHQMQTFRNKQPKRTDANTGLASEHQDVPCRPGRSDSATTALSSFWQPWQKMNKRPDVLQPDS